MLTTEYPMALGAFRHATAQWVAAAAELARVSAALGASAPDAESDEAAREVFAQVSAQLQAIARQVPGIRQLLEESLGGSS